jgi:hypothetical protein
VHDNAPRRSDQQICHLIGGGALSDLLRQKATTPYKFVSRPKSPPLLQLHPAQCEQLFAINAEACSSEVRSV